MEFFIQHYLTLTAIIFTAAAAFILKKIDFGGAVLGVLLAILIYYCGGKESLLALLIFFILGTAASSWKRETKKKYKVAQENEGKRSIVNVLGNGGAAALFALLSFFIPIKSDLTAILITASFAAACSDTLSSELGTIYGKKFFSLINLKSAKRGTDGAVSFEGLGFGVFGSVAVSLVFLIYLQDLEVFLIISTAGILGNIADSILGATLQKVGLLNNHHVNFFATLFGGTIALILYAIS